MSVRSILGLGKSLDIPVLAEGVETQQQLDFLHAANCEEVQGYYFARPACAKEIRGYMQDRYIRAKGPSQTTPALEELWSTVHVTTIAKAKKTRRRRSSAA